MRDMRGAGLSEVPAGVAVPSAPGVPAFVDADRSPLHPAASSAAPSTAALKTFIRQL
jgi:hypothetical protein